MEYLVPLAILVVIAVVAAAIVRWVGRSRRASGTGDAAGAGATARGGRRRPRTRLADRVSAESARAASSRLDEQAHREVYRLIAAGRTAEAVTAYRRSTGRGAVDSLLDIQALATFPQVRDQQQPSRPSGTEDSARGAQATSTTSGTSDSETDDDAGGREPDEGSKPEPDEAGQPEPDEATRPEGADTKGADAVGAEPDPALPETTDLVIPEDWFNEHLPADRPFELEVVRDESTVRITSDDLPPWLRDQLTAMVRDNRLEEAALELAAHSALSAEESLHFLRILKREQDSGSE